jgi:two-component system KDP operon response regulator KdpE
VLVVDDDSSLQRALQLALEHGGYEVISATTGEAGISETGFSSPDVVVLDLGLPDLDGVSVCRRIREWSDVPIIVLSATVAELRKVAALDEGADDYVTKPFSMAELEARIRAVLRARKAATRDEIAELNVGLLNVDLVHREARVGTDQLRLTSREFDLLAFLARHVDKVATHQMILEAVWGSPFAKETQYLHAYVHRLRQKIGDNASIAITTVPGIGYSLATD